MDMTPVYIIIGSLIVANIGTIVTVVISALKLAAAWGKMQARLEENTKDINAAHGKIRDIEQQQQLPRAN